ncbi:hypothetical protein P153DRAFT_350826 [Dothidotthia symphoricarpi CBS 119687]|uniref:Uncharacterized protein n=1 Tax=Dothidotthia symphoricarpi CBS 119687 TaxID=1392245 RepID=A0A6A5ZYY4_9PLEO|nr:uncharacterized protein P153DRAFT_350826 [Dothidotthia symphoricarpi CBS 119687]KAF2124104.1 hypothetical protein P153DRAFT_350826 [Dothidotthia symphoricarpi CBS 119687]
MQFFSILTTLFFASTAMAACAAGPYKTQSACKSGCDQVKRCGDDNWVILCNGGYWQQAQKCNHCKGGACAS